MEKRMYYINIEIQLISEAPIPDDSQFILNATTDEIDEIRNRFNELSELSIDALKYIGKPFNESNVDDQRSNYQEELLSLYELIYDLGTEETRISMTKSGILNRI